MGEAETGEPQWLRCRNEQSVHRGTHSFSHTLQTQVADAFHVLQS